MVSPLVRSHILNTPQVWRFRLDLLSLLIILETRIACASTSGMLFSVFWGFFFTRQPSNTWNAQMLCKCTDLDVGPDEREGACVCASLCPRDTAFMWQLCPFQQRPRAFPLEEEKKPQNSPLFQHRRKRILRTSRCLGSIKAKGKWRAEGQGEVGGKWGHVNGRLVLK